MQNNKYNVILKTTSLFGGVQGLNILLNLIRTKIVAVLLGPDGVGLNSIYNETRELLHSTTNLGLDVSGVCGISKAVEAMHSASDDEEREALRARISDEVALLRSWVLLLALFGTLLCMICAAPLSLATFGNYDYTWGYVMLSPAVGFSTVSCGEIAVLKGLRRLKWLASVSLLNVIAGLVITIPIFYIWGISGVVAALVTFIAACMMLTCAYSYRAEKPRFVFNRKELGRGRKMLTVGFNFVMCSIIGHMALLGIQAYLNRVASLDMVGLYNSGYALTMTYAGMVLAAMDTDYFPRLSGVISNKAERADTLLKQQDVTILLISPLLVGMIVALPLIVPLFLSGRFESIIPMTQVTAVGLLFRAVYLPNAYLSLAAGHNRTYLFINIVGSIDILLVLLGYHYAGLVGMGIALTVQNFMDMALVMGISRYKYGVQFTRGNILSLCVYSAMLLATYALCCWLDGWHYWAAGTAMTALTAFYSFARYRKA